MKKKSIGLCSLVLTASMILAGCKIGDKEIVLETKTSDTNYVFSVGETKCSIEQAKLYFCNYKNLYGSAYGVDLWEADYDNASLEEYVKGITLDELTKVVCMDVVAEQQELELTEKESSNVNKAAKEYYDSLSKAEKDFMGVDEAEVRTIYRNYALAEKLYDNLTEGVNVEVSDDDARVIRIQQINVVDKEIADEVSKRIIAGEDFSAIAGSYANNTSADFTVARGDLPESLEAVAFELNNDEVSSMVQTEGGYYFIKCINKLEDDLTQANKNNILVQREKEQFNQVYEEFVGNAIFYLNEPIWETIALNPEIEIKTDSFFEVYEKHFK